MRIALLHYTRPPVIGGVERVIRDQAAALRVLGHEVEVLTRATMERRRVVGLEKKEPNADDSSALHGPFLDSCRPILKHRHDLPHWQQENALVFVTWRLADSLPQAFIEQWMTERKAWLMEHPRPWDEVTEIAFQKRFDQPFMDRLDQGHGACILRQKVCADEMERVLHHFDGQRYHLQSYVIMPNHVHVLVQLQEGWSLEKVVQNWKERSAKGLNRVLEVQGTVWQKGYFDRLIRGPEHLQYVERYIRQNPVKAKLRSGFRRWSATMEGLTMERRRVVCLEKKERNADDSSALHKLSDFEAVIVHNVFTMPFDLEWTRELREMAAAMPEVRWINWVHDVAAVNPHYAHLPWAQADHAQLSLPVPNALNVTVSEVRRQDYLRATGLPPDQVRVIPNGLDLAAVLGLTERIAALRLWDRELILVHPTRLIRRKNIELGLRVMAALRDAGCDVIYAITGAPDPHQGDGQVYYQELRSLVTELDLASHVLFLGEEASLSDEDVRSLYQAADALFFPSSGEGFGLPLLEACAHRLPVFCSNLPVHCEVLGDEGQYFKIQSKPEEISAQIMQWNQTALVPKSRRHLWRRHEMVKICQEHLEPLLFTANQSS